jgi:type I restriction enzyme, S subunit
MSLPTYAKYKSSGVEWLGDVPAHWPVDRLKASIISCKNGIWGDEPKGDGEDIECVRVADFDRARLVVDGEVPTLRSVSHSERSGRVLKRGDLLLEKSGGGEKQPVGQVVLYDRDEVAVCSNFVAKVTLAEGMVPKFWMYQHAAAYSRGLNVGSIRQTSGIQNLDQSQYFDERGVFPPRSEQRVIADFLDHETAKIDALIAEQEKLLALLAEKRQAAISHAVIRGLDPNAPLKDSGIPWVGEVPAHWEVTRLKFVAAVQTGIAKGKDMLGKKTITVPYLRVANVQDGHLALDEIALIEIEPEQLERYRLQTGDVLMNEGGDFDKLGRGAIWNGEIKDCIHQNHVFAVRPHAVSSQWLNQITSSDYAQFYFMGRSKQSTNLASISSTNIMELPVVLPPEKEQAEILAFIDEQSARLDSLQASASHAIELLKERRSALISAAVTGKIDVRGLAPC